MRYLFVFAAGASLLAQSQSSTYTFDANGNPVLAAQTSTGRGGEVQRAPDLNGRLAPVERVEETVLSNDANGRVVERTVRPFDPNGNPLPPEKQRITERKESDGTRTVEKQIFRGDINGGFALAESVNSVSRSNGTVENTQTEIARPNINGGLEVVEKKEATVQKLDKDTKEDLTIYRRGTNDRFLPIGRVVTDTQQKDGKIVENAVQYSPGEGGSVVLSGQRFSETVKRPDGSEVKQTAVYTMGGVGRPVSSTPELRERQTVETRIINGQTIETRSVQVPSLDDPSKLGAPRKLSERICTGKCQ